MSLGNLSMRAYNPLFARQKGRIIIMLPWEDSLDSSLAFEPFFVMPDAVRSIRKARVWVERKPYRAYETGASSESSHTHTVTIGSHSHGIAYTGQVTSNVSGHEHAAAVANSNSNSGGGSSPTSAGGVGHTHTLTYAISETGPSGNVALFVADDGTNYGSAITSGVTSVSDQDITAQLTKSSGAKRLKITATGLMRVQVLLLLDLSVAVFS